MNESKAVIERRFRNLSISAGLLPILAQGTFRVERGFPLPNDVEVVKVQLQKWEDPHNTLIKLTLASIEWEPVEEGKAPSYVEPPVIRQFKPPEADYILQAVLLSPRPGDVLMFRTDWVPQEKGEVLRHLERVRRVLDNIGQFGVGLLSCMLNDNYSLATDEEMEQLGWIRKPTKDQS